MKKQAVLLIHGVGEQKPMKTLRAFVDAVWTTHPEIHNRFAGHGYWSKPYNVSSSFELRRLTTPSNSKGIETHFFELYWAHFMQGTSYGHVLAWARSLILRRPATVPSHLVGAYWLLVVLAILALLLVVIAAYFKATDAPPTFAWASIISSFVLVPLAAFILLNVVGDAARYLHVAPSNIQRRHEIRAAGVAVLKELHNAEREYDRIIIVGHSLGSVIGYDVLTHAWIDFHREHAETAEEIRALEELERLADLEKADVDDVQKAQRAYLAELEKNGCPWKVSDFITLGSPLAHAAILLADDAADLSRKQEDREFPRCLPALETLRRDHRDVRRFSFEVNRRKAHSYRMPHHAAVFAPTRWTNLFFPCRAIIRGDIVGGPLRGVMGRGIRDVPVATRQRLGFLTHTLYWMRGRAKEGDVPSHISALREALDLTDSRAQP